MFLFVLAGCDWFDNDNKSSGAPVTGTVSGKVVSSATGEAVPDAKINAGTITATSAADGTYILEPAVGERVVIQVEAAGFAETVQIARVTTGQTTSLDVQLLRIGVMAVVDVAAGGTVIVPNSSAEISIPAGTLVRTDGGASSGSVNVALTAINPAIDLDLMPGDFTAVLTGSGDAVPIESFGALRVDVRDDNGERYTLRVGETPSIRIPLGTLSDTPPPATIPLLVFNESTGRWVQEGEATLAGSAPEQFYVGTVQRFGAWNADKPMLTVVVSGCVRDTANQPVANVRVISSGINYSGSSSTITDPNGNFRVEMRRDGLATISVTFIRNGTPETTTINVGPFSAEATLPPPCIVTEPVPPQITTRFLPAGIVGRAYQGSFTASNGTLPYSWSFSGALPPGLTLNNVTGQITGIPTTAGFFSGTIQVADGSTPPQTASQAFSITVIDPAPFGIATFSLPTGIIGTAYNATLAAVNGTSPYEWSVTSGTLPTGLSLSTNGQISGVPTAAGTFALTVEVEDSATPARLASRTFSITVTVPPPFGIATLSLPAGIVGTAYNATLTAVNGTLPYAWTVTVGFLPSGLTLNSATGQISGTPTAARTFAITVEVQDSATPQKSASRAFSITISTVPPPPAPTGVGAFSGDTQVRVIWNAVSGADSYNLYMASVSGVNKGNYSTLADGQRLTGVTSPHIQTGLTNGTTYYFVVTAVNANGESVESLQVSATPVPDTGGGTSDVSTLSAGGPHSCARLENGTIQCWGWNSVGQLGNGTNTPSNTPVQVSGITTATAVSAGPEHTCARLENGTVQCWGYNGLGQLGNGTNTTSNTPVQVNGLP